jgi:predicted transcriptional regulator
MRVEEVLLHLPWSRGAAKTSVELTDMVGRRRLVRKPGRAAVVRALKRLVEEGRVKRERVTYRRILYWRVA